MAVHSSHYQLYWSLSEVTEEWDQNQALRTAFIYDSLSRTWPHKSFSVFGFGLHQDFCFSFIYSYNFYFFLLRQARARGHHTKPGVISNQTISSYWQDYKKKKGFLFSLCTCLAKEKVTKPMIILLEKELEIHLVKMMAKSSICLSTQVLPIDWQKAFVN